MGDGRGGDRQSPPRRRLTGPRRGATTRGAGESWADERAAAEKGADKARRPNLEREGERVRVSEGEWERGRKEERERGREGERKK